MEPIKTQAIFPYKRESALLEGQLLDFPPTQLE